MEDKYTILFKEASITGKRAMRLTPDGGVTNKVLFAAMIKGKAKAEEIAETIRGDFPKATVTVQPF